MYSHSLSSHGNTLTQIKTPKRKVKVIPDWTVGGSASESDEGSDEQDTPVYFAEERKSLDDVLPDYWVILKAMRQLKLGDQRQSLTSLSLIGSFNLTSEFNLAAITTPGSLELLVNVAETNNYQCRASVLSILKQISVVPPIADKLINLGISETLMRRLFDNAYDINQLAAQIVFNIGWRRRASRALRRCGVIQVLVTRLKLKKALLVLDDFNLFMLEKEEIELAKAVAFALWSMSKFRKNKITMLATGIIPELRKILLSGNRNILTPTVGILAECTTEPLFQLSIQNECLVGVLMIGLQSDDAELQRLCSLALSRAAGGNAVVREMIRFHNGPKIIMQVITETDKSNKRLLTAGISALWKSAVSEENVKEFEKLDAVPMLIEFLNETHVEVLVATVGAIAEMAKSETAREMIISKGAMTEIISLLGHINEDLLANSAHAVGVCSDCDEGIEMLDKSDGLRLLWSLMKNQSQRVKVQALWAVKPCVARHPDSGELIRSLMGSLSLLVQMLGHDDCEVLTAVCAVISEVALDLENLAVMTEQGVVKRLSNLITRERRDTIQELAEERAAKGYQGVRFVKQEKRTELHRELASAVANCASLPDNRRAFGRAGVIPVIVGYLATTNSELLAQACRAMHTLSQDHFNCVSMQSCGAVANLLVAIESECMVTQIGAAGALKNIRNMLLKADYKKMAFLCLPRIEREKKQAEIEAIVKVLSGHREPEEEKKAVLKGLARSSLKSMVSFKSKESKEGKEGKKGKEASVNWAESQKKDSGVIRKQSSLLSWRERMSLITETTEEAHKERRPSELEAILAGKAAMRKGSHAAMGSQASQGSRSSAQPATEYATLDDVPPAGDADGDVNSDGVPEPMGAAGV